MFKCFLKQIKWSTSADRLIYSGRKFDVRTLTQLGINLHRRLRWRSS